MTSESTRHRYKALVASTTAAINAADPIGLLDIDAPDDEYEPEIQTIVPRVVTAGSPAEVQAIVHAEFVHWFGADIAGTSGVYQVPAEAIWQAVVTFRQQGTRSAD